MPLDLCPLLDDNLEAAQRLHLTANHDSEPNRTIFPNGASDTTVQHLADLDRKQLYDPESRSRHMQVKDTETGEMVSYALWMFFDHKRGISENSEREGSRSGKTGEATEAPRLDKFPVDANVEALEVLFAKGREKRDELMKGVYAYACR